jgi:hypothetical protein
MARKWVSTNKFVISRDKIFLNIGYTLFDQKRKGEILEELKVEPVDKTLRRYKSNWLQGHVTWMINRMPKIMLNLNRMEEHYLEKI